MDADPHFSSVSLLLRMNGADGSTTFTDESPTPKTISVAGDAQLATAAARYGTAGLVSAGGAGYIHTPSADVADFGAGDFCIELSVKTPVDTLDAIEQAWVTVLGGTPFDHALEIGFRGSAMTFGAYQVYVKLFLATEGTVTPFEVSVDGVLPAEVYQDIQISRSGASLWIRRGGNLVASSTELGAGIVNFVPGTPLKISAGDSQIGAIRITKGTPRNLTNYLPDDEEFADFGGATISGNVKNATGTNVARVVRAYREDTGALVGGTTSNGSTGNYTIQTTHTGGHTLAFYPAGGEALNALVLRGVVGE